ncbi:outer envelope pore protein 37, chloroplastic isoform X1 [Brachypodium distachyon]|uniref:outer envelope pore protein 37, chloroplastic isoform X1 n=1 Tax=Brachypodium distachyon TaxID=15368 RepID=UPI00052FF85E|nr:outer envelope pore protein 37, chloroplastic isoform X1 [Brachypodium distachyon]|eukprot:XP_010238602.1 outer envelope pore protein 37, chloroplastic isoform X1 [Brachypodium distachyon]
MAAPALLSAPQPMDGDGDGVAPHAAPSPTQPPPERGFLSRRPPVRVTSEFDSERKLFSHRISCRVLDGLAKLRLRVHQGAAGGVGPGPEVALVARNFSVVVDTASRGAVLRGAADLAGSLRLRASHNTKNCQNGEQSYIHIGCSTNSLSMSCDYQCDSSIVSCVHVDRYFQLKCDSRKEGLGEVAVTTNLGDSPCKMEISSLVPPDGLPRATFVFPNGEVSVKEKKLDEGEKILSVNGIVKSHVLNGVCTALYNDNAMNIKYRYKDDELSFIPSLSLPSNSLSFAFKRQLTPSDKFSYRYHFDTNYWSAVYKQKASKHVKWKAGYESDERLGWASLWVGDAGGKTKETPLKSKIQLMLKVPQDNIQNSIVVFRVKKRWDF